MRKLIFPIVALMLWSCDESGLDPAENDLLESSGITNLDTTLIYQSWYSEKQQFGFTIRTDGSIEFLQRRLSDGKLVHPFTESDKITFDFTDSVFTLDLVNLQVDHQYPWGGVIVQLTDSSLLIDHGLERIFVLYHNFIHPELGDEPFEFKSVDLDEFKLEAFQGKYSAKLTTRTICGSDGEWQDSLQYEFVTPNYASDLSAGGKYNTSKELKLKLVYFAGNTILGGQKPIHIDCTINDFHGIGEYNLTNSMEVVYSEFSGDMILAGPAQEAKFNIIQFDKTEGVVSGTFNFKGSYPAFMFEAQEGYFELPMEVID